MDAKLHGSDGQGTHAVAIDGYDYGAHGWDRGGSMNPECARAAFERLRRIVINPDGWQATTDGGWPRCGWGDVLAVEMHKPASGPDTREQPSFLLTSWLGVSWHPWYMLSDIRRRVD